MPPFPGGINAPIVTTVSNDTGPQEATSESNSTATPAQATAKVASEGPQTPVDGAESSRDEEASLIGAVVGGVVLVVLLMAACAFSCHLARRREGWRHGVVTLESKNMVRAAAGRKLAHVCGAFVTMSLI